MTVLVDEVVLDHRLDLMISKVFSNPIDSLILCFCENKVAAEQPLKHVVSLFPVAVYATVGTGLRRQGRS